MSAAAEDSVTEAPAVEAVPKRAMTLGTGTSLVILGVLLILPMFVKNFIAFQLTMVMIYGIAVLALNILTGGSGQFSLGQSAFYALGAYTSAVLMENANVNYALTLPIAGLVSFGAGKNHCAFYPGAHPIAACARELAGYDTSKGTIRFTPASPLPAALVAKIVRLRLAEHARQAASRRKPPGAPGRK